MIQIPCQLQQHANEKIEYYCFSICCQENRLLCYKCLQQTKHQDHQVLKLSGLNEHTKEFSDKCQEIISKLLDYKFQFIECIDELVINLQQKFQQQPNNLSQFTYDQLESYLSGLLKFEENNLMIHNEVLQYLELAKNNILHAIDGLDVKAGLHYQAPPEIQQQVIELQNLGTQLFRNQNIMQAQDVMNRTLILDPNNSTTLVMKGTLLLSQTKNYEASKIFDRVLKVDPNNIQAINGLGDALRGRSKFSEALQQYEKTLERDPDNKQALLGKAHCLGKDKKFQDAKKIYDRILNQNQNDMDALWGLADLVRIQQKDEEAIRLYNKVLQLNQNHVESLSGKGDCYRLLGKFDDAMKCLQKAQQLSPKHVLNLTRIGDCLRQQKKFLEAINYYSEALSIDPQDEWSQSKINECRINIQKRQQ
ncbi:unnamed protein product [Paramecium pentaurelia]|uniref:Tetratricopeptide repeat protein 21A/21B C-terminal ARM domain-containing protein n=1 Tax=Paramecium pentaurelia TaxID=43138 RepID=A0A8S1XGL6_9CILI|nr:unnamed protein product [Paramecium pentaurelia]